MSLISCREIKLALGLPFALSLGLDPWCWISLVKIGLFPDAIRRLLSLRSLGERCVIKSTNLRISAVCFKEKASLGIPFASATSSLRMLLRDLATHLRFQF